MHSSEAPQAAPLPTSSPWRPGLQLFLSSLAAFTFFLRLHQGVNTLLEHDGYYHIKVAELMTRQGFLLDFPWAAFSMFKEGYGDKELLFHVALMPFTSLELTAGARLAILIFSTAMVSLTFWLLLRHKVPFAAAWLALYGAAGSVFFWRMSQCRPHLGSILCVLLGLHFLSRQRWRPLFLLSVIYALAYTASHVLLILALLATGVHWIFTRRLPWKLPLATLLGLALGFCLHPNFPHNIRIWKIQSIDFYTFAWASDLLGLGWEIHPLGPLEFARQHALLLILWALAAWGVARGWRKVQPETGVLTMGALAFGGLAYTGARFTEYFTPLSVLALATLFRDLEWRLDRLWSMPRGRVALALAVVLVGGSAFIHIGEFRSYIGKLNPAKQEYERSMTAMGRLLAAEAPGELVYHSAWSDSPALLLYNDRSHYLVVLDPIYFYTYDRAAYLTWRALNEGGTLPGELTALAPAGFPTQFPVVQTLQQTFHTRFVVARVDAQGLAQVLAQSPGVKVRFRSALYTLFELPR